LSLSFLNKETTYLQIIDAQSRDKIILARKVRMDRETPYTNLATVRYAFAYTIKAVKFQISDKVIKASRLLLFSGVEHAHCMFILEFVNTAWSSELFRHNLARFRQNLKSSDVVQGH